MVGLWRILTVNIEAYFNNAPNKGIKTILKININHMGYLVNLWYNFMLWWMKNIIY